jgi:hypothetical protein
MAIKSKRIKLKKWKRILGSAHFTMEILCNKIRENTEVHKK